MAKKRGSKGNASVAKKPKADKEEKRKVVEAVEEKFLEHHEIAELAEKVTKDRKYNGLVPLIDEYQIIEKKLLKEGDQSFDKHARLLTEKLTKCFEVLISSSVMEETKDEKKKLIASWVRDKYDKFRARLCWFVNTRLPFQASVQLDAVDSYLALLEEETTKYGEFPVAMYQELVIALLASDIGCNRPDGRSDNYVVQAFSALLCDDRNLQLNLFHDSLADKLVEWQSLERPTRDKIFANYFELIKDGLVPDDEESTSPDDLTDDLKAKFQKCFLAWVRLPDLSAAQYKLILNSMDYSILPYLSTPSSMMDFLTDSFDQEEDEVVHLLVIKSLWQLMKDYNLEYPDFYNKLYSLLTPNLLYIRYRARFFRQLDLFLSSTHLSANLVASFIKRLARLALSAPAPGVVILFPFIYNLLKRHPTCMIMLQNSEGRNNPDYKDPFDNKETNPQKTGALGSSLWELETLQSHYHPNIATLARIFGEPFRKPSYNMEDFLDWTYASLLDSEEKRRYKGLAALEYEEWETLFGQDNAFMGGWKLR
ncbi:hypothetical protein FDK38_000415 [Candidozyma auris]|nr:hypothetical protein FDK38_000415 [[Candida] auris]